MKNEEGKKENVTPDDITKQETDIDPDLTPEDWTTGNEEDIEIGTKEDFITPGGQANDWQQGEDEQVTFDSTNLNFLNPVNEFFQSSLYFFFPFLGMIS